MKYLSEDYNKYGSDDGPSYDEIWDLFLNINMVATGNSNCKKRAGWVSNYRIGNINDHWILDYAQENLDHYSAYTASEKILYGKINKIISYLEKAAIIHLLEGNRLRAISCYNKIIVIDNTNHQYVDREYLIKIYEFLSVVHQYHANILKQEISLLKQKEPFENRELASEINKTIFNLETAAITHLLEGDRLGAISCYNKIIATVKTNHPYANREYLINEYLIKICEYLSVVEQYNMNSLEQEIAPLKQEESFKNKKQEPAIAIAIEKEDDDKSTISSSSQKESLENEEQEPVEVTKEVPENIEQVLETQMSVIANDQSSSATTVEEEENLALSRKSVQKSFFERGKFSVLRSLSGIDGIFTNKALNIEYPEIRAAIVNRPQYYDQLNKHVEGDARVKFKLKNLFPPGSYTEYSSYFHDKSISILLKQYESPAIPDTSSFIALPKIPDFSYNGLSDTAISLNKALIYPLSLYDTIRLLSFITKEAIEHSPEIKYFLTDKLHLDQLSIVKKSQEMIPDYLNDLSTNQYLITTAYFASCFISLTTITPYNFGNFVFSTFITLNHHMVRNYKLIHNLLLDFRDIIIISMAYPDISSENSKIFQTIIIKNTVIEKILPLFKIQQQADYELSMITNIVSCIIDLVVFVSLFNVLRFDEKIPHKSSLVEAMYVVKRISIAFDLTIALDSMFRVILYDMDERFITPAINYFGFGSDDINVAGEIENMEITTEL